MGLKRRSSMGHALHGPQGTPNRSIEAPQPLDQTKIGEADEQRERQARRGIQKRQSLGHGVRHTPAGKPGTPQVTNAMSGYSAAQLSEHYNNCMKLSAENKISIKNAFQLKMIDYMAEMVKKKESNIDNFQAASCALDASTKIYAYRVDSVHSETLKLASGVGTNKEKEDGKADADGADGDDGEMDVAKKRKKRKRATMVEKNLGNINCSKFELEFDVDPLFKKVSAQFDSGGGGGQFLSTLRIKDDGCQLMLDSNALTGSDLAPFSKEEGEELEDLVLPKVEESLVICPTFQDFTFRDWSLEKESEMQEDSAEDEEKNGVEENDDMVFDAEAAANNDDFFGGADDGGGDFALGDDMGEDEEGVAKDKPRLTIANMDVKTLRDHLATVPNEYSYFDTGRLGAWAGPKHWKFKPVQRVQVGEEDKKKKQKKDKEKLNFEDLDDVDKLIKDHVEKVMTLPKKSIKLQNRTMENWNDERNFLPEDRHYSGKDFVKLEGMVKSNVAPGRAQHSQSVDENVDDYDFDNANDTQNYCPDLPADSYGGNATTGEGFSNVFSQTTMMPDSQNEEGGGPLGLVTAPNRVEKIQIGYAKLAKKIDMRRLKSVEWDILNRSRLDVNKENESGNAGGEKDDTAMTTASQSRLVEEGTTFNEMFTTLRVSRSLPSKMKEGLSVPLAFVALLHLCNEETLDLKNNSDFSNLTISKA